MIKLSTHLICSLRDPLKGMSHDDFHHYLARYKFVFALENAVCEDYITEKFWRPFIIGSVPIIYGSPKARVRKSCWYFLFIKSVSRTENSAI